MLAARFLAAAAAAGAGGGGGVLGRNSGRSGKVGDSLLLLFHLSLLVLFQWMVAGSFNWTCRRGCSGGDRNRRRFLAVAVLVATVAAVPVVVVVVVIVAVGRSGGAHCEHGGGCRQGRRRGGLTAATTVATRGGGPNFLLPGYHCGGEEGRLLRFSLSLRLLFLVLTAKAQAFEKAHQPSVVPLLFPAFVDSAFAQRWKRKR
mmetsp:Transcript_42932/g.84648  ORF Transcript_42932/g.84648 Transcript_42932/m.84648 type:complete len:202 (+) Transcript_42932:1-606(+)